MAGVLTSKNYLKQINEIFQLNKKIIEPFLEIGFVLVGFVVGWFAIAFNKQALLGLLCILIML